MYRGGNGSLYTVGMYGCSFSLLRMALCLYIMDFYTRVYLCM